MKCMKTKQKKIKTQSLLEIEDSSSESSKGNSCCLYFCPFVTVCGSQALECKLGISNIFSMLQQSSYWDAKKTPNNQKHPLTDFFDCAV